MKVRNVGGIQDEKVEVQMTPMIDIVFQLLIFFIMTFKIVSPEGDFNIKMPLAAPSEGMPDDNQLPPIKVTMRAGAGGSLSTITMGSKGIGNFDELRAEIRAIVGDDSGPGSIAESTGTRGISMVSTACASATGSARSPAGAAGSALRPAAVRAPAPHPPRSTRR